MVSGSASNVMKNSGDAVFPTALGWVYLLLPVFVLGLSFYFIGIGWDGLRRVGLFLPGCWFAWRALTTGKTSWKIATYLWVFVFSIDAVVRIYLWVNYQAKPDSVFVLLAMANTGSGEMFEYSAQYWPQFLFATLIIGTSVLWFHLLGKPRLYQSGRRSVLRVGGISFLVVLVLAAYLIRSSRDAHPLNYWLGYSNRLSDFRSGLQNTETIRQGWDVSAAKAYLGYNGGDQQTFVLVIGESTTSNNFQLCGYPRETTPKLESLRADLTVFCNAYSAAASTLPSIRMMLTSEELGQSGAAGKETSLLAMARNAGFKIYWISNQDDVYTWSTMGKYADEAVFINRRSGRDSKSLDYSVLSDYKRILSSNAPRKLIVVHLLGAHPNYASRYPDGYSFYNSDTDDVVGRGMKAAGRNLWVRWQRANYDNAMRYQDSVLSDMLLMLRKSPGNDPRSWLYVSDHGNEVGHVGDFAGHSPSTEAGYKVPLIYWSNRGDYYKTPELFKDRVILTDVLDNNVAMLMGIKSIKSRQDVNWFSDGYIWKMPERWPIWLKHDAE